MVATSSNHFPPDNYVFDSSAIVATLLPDEKNQEKAQYFLTLIKTGYLVCPEIINFEVPNAIKSAYLRGRVSKTATKILLKNFFLITITTKETDPFATLSLALQHQLSFYDASYLSLAIRYNCPLITLDKELLKLSPIPTNL